MSNNFSVSKDPVNMSNGAFLFDGTDLSLGGAPLGLSMARSYDSSRNLEKGPLGYGWSHNKNIRLSVTSDGAPGLGARSAIDAAAYLAVQYINVDLLKNSSDIDAWMVASLNVKWVIDQLIDNAATVHVDNKILEYIKLPDGSYSPPPGVTKQLIRNGDGAYRLQERFGTKMHFDTDKNISHIEDIDGNAMTFTYNGNKLTSVQDAFGRTLTFSYSGDKVSSVADSAGRSVSYAYDADNLTGFTNPEGKTWNYGYDANHRLTTITNPLNLTTVTNVYDSMGQVMTQTTPRQTGNATYNFYFSGFRNQEVDPSGNAITRGTTTTLTYDAYGNPQTSATGSHPAINYAYDPIGRMTSLTDQVGSTTSFVYDKRNLLQSKTDPLGRTSTFVYDHAGRLTSKTEYDQHRETKPVTLASQM